MTFRINELEVDELGAVVFSIGVMFAGGGSALFTTTSEILGLLFYFVAVALLLSGLYYIILDLKT